MSYGTLKKSKVNRIKINARDVWEVVIDWVSDITGGTYRGGVGLNLATVLASQYPKMFLDDTFGGFLLGVQTAPGRYGDLQTNIATSMHMKLYDYHGETSANIASEGMDIMQGVLYNRSSSAIEVQWADPPILLNSELHLNIGSTKTIGAEGRIILWIEK